jgi:hypothetical protein
MRNLIEQPEKVPSQPVKDARFGEGDGDPASVVGYDGAGPEKTRKGRPEKGTRKGDAAASAVPRLIDLLEGCEDLAEQAIYTLGAIGPGAAVAIPALQELLGPHDFAPASLRDEVRQALKRIRTSTEEEGSASRCISRLMSLFRARSLGVRT